MPNLTRDQIREKWYSMGRDSQIENLIHLIKRMMFKAEHSHLFDVLHTILQLNPKEAHLVEDVEIYTKLKELFQ